MSLDKHKQDWEELADMDPYWAILFDPELKFGKWNIDEFFLTGEREIEQLMESVVRLGLPLKRKLVLDFGCGVGRLSRALAKYFSQCYGVDISENMIIKAKELNSSVTGCKFIVNTKENLKMFTDNYFDMVYSNIVLQHLPNRKLIKTYISEFVRILKKDGLLIFQLPSLIPLKNRLQLRRRLYAFLRLLAFNNRFLYEKLGLNPIRMNFIPEKQVRNFLNTINAKVLDIQVEQGTTILIQSRTYYVTK